MMVDFVNIPFFNSFYNSANVCILLCHLGFNQYLISENNNKPVKILVQL